MTTCKHYLHTFDEIVFRNFIVGTIANKDHCSACQRGIKCWWTNEHCSFWLLKVFTNISSCLTLLYYTVYTSIFNNLKLSNLERKLWELSTHMLGHFFMSEIYFNSIVQKGTRYFSAVFLHEFQQSEFLHLL